MLTRYRPTSGSQRPAFALWEQCESSMIHIMASATIRDLRTRFPKLKLLVERDGEVVITDHGRPAFLLLPYRTKAKSRVKRIDYFRRLRARQPKPLSMAASRALDEGDRGER